MLAASTCAGCTCVQQQQRSNWLESANKECAIAADMLHLLLLLL
jgi:hypothetical protein